VSGERRERAPEIEIPPEGAECSVHHERDAIVVCPACGAYACLECWHQAFVCCHECLLRTSAEEGAAVPWESSEGTALERFARTLGAALSPVQSAPSFGHADRRSAYSFFMLTFVPLALVYGVVPFTSEIVFGPAFGVHVRAGATTSALLLDALRGCAIGVLVAATQLVALAAPYISLVRAYAGRGNPDAAMRALGYRAFLIPAAAMLGSLVAWCSPEGLSEGGATALALLSVAPLVLLLSALRASARTASGVPPLMSLVVVLISMTVMFMAHAGALQLVAPLLPSAESLQQIVGQPG
jgi:hypothetical protein